MMPRYFVIGWSICGLVCVCLCPILMCGMGAAIGLETANGPSGLEGGSQLV